ncbi:MAG: hypothetical protein WC823_03210 [Parcubacteria group bacterium]|jgi:UDP-3-O-acyl-N-acetylglucosamine deacetylase
MNILRLKESVVVSGMDIFGRRSQIKFFPFNLPGWYWRCGSEIVPITLDIALCNPRRITLKYKDYCLEIYEHIGALRWTGLDGVVIESPRLPPYHGRTGELWHALKPFCRETGEKALWIKPSNVCDEITSREGCRSVSLESLDSEGLSISVSIEIEGLGNQVKNCELPMALDNVFDAHTLGWPSRLYYFSKLAGIIGWPHHKNIAWAQTSTQEGLLDKISLHRIGDLLGALSLITHDHLVSGRIISHRGGHRLDMDMINKIEMH